MLRETFFLIFIRTRSASKILHRAFSTYGNTVVLKLCVHVTEDIPTACAKFRSEWLKITTRREKKQWHDTDSCV